MLFQNDIPIDVGCHRYALNMQVSSGTKNYSSPNEPSCTIITVLFNGVLLVVTGNRQSDCKLNLDSSENITQDHCCSVHNACSLLQVNRNRQWVAVSGTHRTGLRACRPMCPKRLYMVCLEPVVPIAEDSWRDSSDTTLCLFLLVETAEYRSSFGVVTRGRSVL